MTDDNNPVKWWNWVLISLILFVTIEIFLCYIMLLKNLHLSPEIILGAELVLGVIALIVSLTFMTVIFRSLDLTNSGNSLGLPEGSMRAVIALSLILIFMISSVFLFYQIDIGGRFVSTGVTQAQIENMSQEGIVEIHRENQTYNNESVFTITRVVKNQTSEDIAKQIITTVSTLVVAIAGFYFGTKAVSTTKAGTPKVSVPVIRRIEPTELKPGEEVKEFKIFGKNFELAKDVKLIRDSGQIECANVKSSPTMITCTLKINDDAQPGKYTVVVLNSDGGEDRFEDAFEVKPK